MHQLPNIEKTDSKGEIFCLNGTKYIGTKTVCKNFKTDTDNLNIVGCRYQNNVYFENTGIDWQKTSHSWQNEVIFNVHCHILQTVHCGGRNNFSWGKHTLAGTDFPFLMSFFPLYLVLKLSFNTTVLDKTFYWVQVFDGILDFLYLT